MVTVLKGQRLQEEIKNLKKCPVLLAMFKEMRAEGVSACRLMVTNHLNFMKSAGAEYRARKGQYQMTIGGVSQALAELEQEEGE